MAKSEILKAGELDTLIKVYLNNRSQNDYGEVVYSKSFSKDVWAKLLTTGIKGNEKIEDDTLRAEYKVAFLVRDDSIFYISSTTLSTAEKICIKHDNKFWNIVSVEPQGRGRGILLRCTFTDNDYPEFVE
tara:strand:- start:20362 stop:20751 length:390 start_codon:yes stop_codon:yes gene_type:complete